MRTEAVVFARDTHELVNCEGHLGLMSFDFTFPFSHPGLNIVAFFILNAEGFGANEESRSNGTLIKGLLSENSL